MLICGVAASASRGWTGSSGRLWICQAGAIPIPLASRGGEEGGGGDAQHALYEDNAGETSFFLCLAWLPLTSSHVDVRLSSGGASWWRARWGGETKACTLISSFESGFKSDVFLFSFLLRSVAGSGVLMAG